ncbi:glycoside hydrolase family 3 N-terminal domain-containing protein [Aphanothece sacrum]|uniref:beta-N-acetylhexosaminidase n=1 Tax=Aphanothece sacrum FPU1 TaxID=1920663 RepID=A0A401IEM3_APHSA|nr:glycoside hydrolase family 3 N-terminal domain-containing protein [Aphanothece sacrum]GBF79659.1 glycoside hydrolase [Aphanothece sacrum FPU1]GBF87119.1 glycoside hydrolase family protein [Aphanothece sacrum FPU3]
MADKLPVWTLKQQIGQMIVVRASGYLFDHQISYPAWEPPNQTLRHWLENLNLGGVILLGGSAAELALKTQQLQQWATTPLLIAADIEEGVGQRFSGATWFPPPMALGVIAQQDLGQGKEYAAQMGVITAQEALAIGINWILAPVVDVNNNPDNPVINVRSFSDDPQIVSQLASAFIQGANTYPVLTTAKHFPGHGDTSHDSHLDLPVIAHESSRLNEVELVPFKEVIKAGVDSVMTGHLLIEAWDKERPATLSKPILTDKLRQELGFDKLIVTDALIMGGIANYASPEEVAVIAIEAGADILLMPKDPEKTIEAIYQAVESGRITPQRIEDSLNRIWQAKQKLSNYLSGNGYNPLLSLEQLSQIRATQTVKNILKDSIQIGGKLPLSFVKKKEKRNLIVVDNLLSCKFLEGQKPAVMIPEKLGYDLQLIEQNNLELFLKDDRVTLLQIFIRGNPFRGNAGLTDEAQKVYKKLIKKEKVQGLIIYGSPYVKDWFLEKTKVFKTKLPWIFSYGQMADSQKIACETLFDLSQPTEQVKDTLNEFM